jgi:hypothetical protein
VCHGTELNGMTGAPSCIAKALLILLCVNLTACIGATRLPRRTRSAQGIEKNFTLDSIHIGDSRADVEPKLRPFDTGIPSRHFLVARWSVSTWGAWAFACGYTNCAGTAGRHWSRHNLIVQFDDNDVVNRLHVFPDSDLVARMSQAVRQDDPIDLSNPIQLHVLYRNCKTATITLARDSFQFVEDAPANRPHNFTISAGKVIGVGTSRIGPKDEASITEVIHFRDAPKVPHDRSSKQLSVRMTVPDLFTFSKFVAAVDDQRAVASGRTQDPE